jgi:hypothetical protein
MMTSKNLDLSAQAAAWPGQAEVSNVARRNAAAAKEPSATAEEMSARVATLTERVTYFRMRNPGMKGRP